MEHEKVVLITSGSFGLGSALAFSLAKLSAKLAIVGQREDALRRIALFCEKHTGLKPLTIIADVNEADDCQRIIHETLVHYGKIDILVNNAGMMGAGGIKNTSMQIFDQVINTNIKSVYYLTKLAIPSLIESKGLIINISPPPSQPNAPAVVHNIARVALNNFTKSIASELKPDGVTVNSINPQYTSHAEFVDIHTVVMDVINNTCNQVSIKAIEIAPLIIFLASARGKYTTGFNFICDWEIPPR